MQQCIMHMQRHDNCSAMHRTYIPNSNRSYWRTTAMNYLLKVSE